MELFTYIILLIINLATKVFIYSVTKDSYEKYKTYKGRSEKVFLSFTIIWICLVLMNTSLTVFWIYNIINLI